MAYYFLNLKMLNKDKLTLIWTTLLPSVFLMINFNNVHDLLELRFWWTYIIVTSYVFGIGIHALRQKEDGTLKTYFSIKNTPLLFFLANLFTQITFSFVSILLFNLLASLLFNFSIILLTYYSTLLILISIPFAFFCYNISLIRKVHFNSLTTCASMFIFVCMVMMSVNTNLNMFNPIIYISQTLTMSSIQEYLVYTVVSLFCIATGGYSIKHYSAISHEVR